MVLGEAYKGHSDPLLLSRKMSEKSAVGLIVKVMQNQVRVCYDPALIL